MLENIQKSANKASLVYIIVLAGVVGVEEAARAADISISLPFTPSRVDTRQE